MQSRPSITMSVISTAATALICVLFAMSASAQQSYVSRYDAFAGFSYFDSPKVSLSETGYHLQAGIRMRHWYSIGFDYSHVNGNLTLTPNLLLNSLQQQIGVNLAGLAAAGLLPPGYQLAVKSESTTQTFAAGPQFAYRRWSWITPFIRPSLGAIREVATPNQPIRLRRRGTAISTIRKKTGLDRFLWRWRRVRFPRDEACWAASPSGLRLRYLFNDILKDGRKTVRFSIGRAFDLGRNVER